MPKQDHFNTLIENYKREHNITPETDFVRLFIREAGSLLSLARKSFELLAVEPTMEDDFGEKLLKCFKANAQGLEPKGGFSYLSYYWGSRQDFIVPGFLINKEEIERNYVKIAAENLYWKWTSERRQDWLDRVDFTFSLLKYPHDLHLDKFYDDKLNQSPEKWDDLINLLLSFDKDPRYHLMVKGLYDLLEVTKVVSNFGSYQEAIDKWERLIGTKQRFPFKIWGASEKWELEVEKQFEIMESELDQKCIAAYDPQLLKKDFLEQQIIDYLSNPGFDRKEYISYMGMKKFPLDVRNITKDRFEGVIGKMVAVKFRDQLFRQVNQDVSIIDSPSATTKELGIVAALMKSAGIVKSEKSAFEFMALHFRVRDKGKKISQKTPDTLRKALNEIKKTKTQSFWKALRNKFEADLSSEK